MTVPTYKHEQDLTPTERFILDHGTEAQKKELNVAVYPAGPAPAPEPRDPNAPTWTGTNTLGNVEPEPSKLDQFSKAMTEARSRMQDLRKDHPAVDFGVDMMSKFGVPGSLGKMVASGVDAVSKPDPPKPRPDGVFTRDLPQPGQPWSAGVSPYSLPDVKGVDVHSLPDAKPAGSTPGAPAPERTGLGSDRALQNAQRDQIQGAQALVDKKMDEAGAQLRYSENKADTDLAAAHLRSVVAEAQKREDDRFQKDLADFEQAKTDAVDKASKLGIDPGRNFRGRETQAALMLGIGGAISGVFGALMGTTENAFIKSVRQNVQNDIDIQDKEIAQAWRKVDGMETTYQNLVRRGVDKRLAQSTYYGQILDSQLGILNAQLAKAKLPVEKANLEGAIQTLQNERTALDVNLQTYWKTVYDKRQAAAAAAAAAAAERLWRHQMEMQELGIKKYNAETNRLEAEGKAANGKGTTQKAMNENFAPTGIDKTSDGVPVQRGLIAADSTARKDLVDAGRAHEQAKKAIAEIRRLRGEGTAEPGQNEPAGGGLGRATSKVTPWKQGWERGVESESSSLKAALNKGAGLGAYDNGTAALLESRVGDLRSVGSAGDEVLNQLEKQVDRDYDAYLNSHGARPAVRVYNKDTRSYEVRELEPGKDLRAPEGDGVKGVPGAREMK